MEPIRHELPQVTDAPRWHGQRWVWYLGETPVVMETAWNWSGQTMERLQIGNEIVFDRAKSAEEMQILFTWTDFYTGEWDDDGRTSRVILALRSGLTETKAKLLRDGIRLAPDDYMTAKWNGQLGKWPA